MSIAYCKGSKWLLLAHGFFSLPEIWGAEKRSGGVELWEGIEIPGENLGPSTGYTEHNSQLLRCILPSDFSFWDPISLKSSAWPVAKRQLSHNIWWIFLSHGERSSA